MVRLWLRSARLFGLPLLLVAVSCNLQRAHRELHLSPGGRGRAEHLRAGESRHHRPHLLYGGESAAVGRERSRSAKFCSVQSVQ